MKSKLISLAFLLVFAFSTSAFADGETGIGSITDPPPPPPLVSSVSNDTSNNLLTQILNAFFSVTP